MNAPGHDFCVKVVFPNDNDKDYLLLKKDDLFEHNYLFVGKLQKEDVTVDVVLADPDEIPREEYTTVGIFFLVNYFFVKHHIVQ